MSSSSFVRERQRILDENRRRRREIDPALYDRADPAERLAVEGRVALAARELRELGLPPTSLRRCLEVGVGSSGWLPVFDDWGVPSSGQIGIDLDLWRVGEARRRHDASVLAVADGTSLPLRDASVDLVVTSTVFSSILDPRTQEAVAAEIERVVRPGGALVLYDLRIDNPRNPNVRGVGRRRIGELFPGLDGRIRSLGLAPPLARRVAPRSPVAARCLERLPFLRSHVLATLLKAAPTPLTPSSETSP